MDFCYGALQEKVMLYADDTLLMLGDTEVSLQEAMSTITKFGGFSGLHIYWTKSALLLLDGNATQTVASTCPVPITTFFKYLGIQVTSGPQDFSQLHISPLLQRFREKVKTWNALRLSVAGKVNLIKMILVPQLLYFLNNAPVVLSF